MTEELQEKNDDQKKGINGTDRALGQNTMVVKEII